MIYTGYYSKVKVYIESGLVPVSISRTKPEFIKEIDTIFQLAPEQNILWNYKNGVIDEMEYTSKYLSQLDRIGIREILKSIHKYGDNVVLLCWEAPDKFCHRHILADYINKRTNLNIKEYTNE